MSRCVRLEDIRDAIIDLNGKVHLERGTAKPMLETIVGLPKIDIVYCKDCKWSDPNQEGDYDCKRRIPIFRVDADGWCYLGERIDNE